MSIPAVASSMLPPPPELPPPSEPTTVLSLLHSVRDSITTSLSPKSAPTAAHLHPLNLPSTPSPSSQLAALRPTLASFTSSLPADPADPQLTQYLGLLKERSLLEQAHLDAQRDTRSIAELLQKRDEYPVPYVQAPPNGSPPDAPWLAGRVEGAAKELGVDAFQDVSTSSDGSTVITLTIAGMILVIDLDISTHPSTPISPKLTRLKITYATASSEAPPDTSALDALLQCDLTEFVAPPPLEGGESTELRAERAFRRFRQNLAVLVSLDKRSAAAAADGSAPVDFFAVSANLVALFENIQKQEDSTAEPLSEHLHLRPSLSAAGHGLPLPHSKRPYVTHLLHISGPSSAQHALSPSVPILSLPGAYSLTVSLSDKLPPSPAAAPAPNPSTSATPAFPLLSAPPPLDVPDADKIGFVAQLEPALSLPRPACHAVLEALGRAFGSDDPSGAPNLPNVESASWSDLILLTLDIVPNGLPAEREHTLPDSPTQRYTLAPQAVSPPAFTITRIPFAHPSELLRVVEIIKPHLAMQEIFSSCFTGGRVPEPAATSENEAITLDALLNDSTPSSRLPITVSLSSNPPGVILTLPTPSLPSASSPPLSLTVTAAPSEGFRVRTMASSAPTSLVDLLARDESKMAEVVRVGRSVPLLIRWLARRLAEALEAGEIDGESDAMKVD